MLANTRVAWFNGAIVPEGQVLIPYRDRSWKSGDGAFDMTRTFNGAIFRLQEHIERFYKSLRYVRIDPGLSPSEMIAATEEVVARNEHLRAPFGDWWVGQRVSRGVDAVGDEGWEHTGPNLVIDVTPLPLASRAAMYRDGAEVMTTTMRRTAPSMLSPRAKMNNYLNMVVAGHADQSGATRRLAAAARRERQPRRGLRQQHLHRPGRRAAHAARALRAARRQPADDHGSGGEARHSVRGGRHRPLRRGQRRRDVPDRDQPLHPAGQPVQRRRRSAPRPGWAPGRSPSA